MNQNRLSEDIFKIAKKIRLFILDVDGILTNGKIYVAPNGDEMIQFHYETGSLVHHLLYQNHSVQTSEVQNDSPAVPPENRVDFQDAQPSARTLRMTAMPKS